MVLLTSSYDTSTYLKSEDIKGERKFRVKDVTEEEVGDKKERKLVVWLVSNDQNVHGRGKALPAIGVAIRAVRIREVEPRTKRIGRSPSRIECWHARRRRGYATVTALRECVLDGWRDCCVAKLGPEIGSKIPATIART